MATKQLTISAAVEITDILMAELGEIGFDILCIDKIKQQVFL